MDDDDNAAARPPRPASLTRALFLEWRKPRFGTKNPERMTNPVWQWLAARPDLTGYAANQLFDGPSSYGEGGVGPCWSNQRYGQSKTSLPDGRVIFIAGEHEDSYDPDFWIYNDVFVVAPSGEIEIYGYPRNVFRPTDFHSATLVGDRIYLIGTLGYARDRRIDVTRVYTLDLTTFAIASLPTTGTNPGWLHSHEATLVDNDTAIVVRGGKRMVAVTEDGRDTTRFVDNGDDWRLDLGTNVWTRLSDRGWQHFELRRSDGRSNDLFTVWSLAWHLDRDDDYNRQQRDAQLERLGAMPDMTAYRTRYEPPLPHDVINADADETRGIRIAVDGITIKYVESSFTVHVTIEGRLAPEKVATLIEDVRQKLSTVERVPYVTTALPSP